MDCRDRPPHDDDDDDDDDDDSQITEDLAPAGYGDPS